MKWNILILALIGAALVAYSMSTFGGLFLPSIILVNPEILSVISHGLFMVLGVLLGAYATVMSELAKDKPAKTVPADTHEKAIEKLE